MGFEFTMLYRNEVTKLSGIMLVQNSTALKLFEAKNY